MDRRAAFRSFEFGVDDETGIERDRRAFRDALGRYPTGVAVATTRDAAGRPHGITINSFASVSLDPPLILWSIARRATTADAFLSAPYFAISVLAEHQEALARAFSWSAADRFAGVATVAGLGEVPLLETALAAFECQREAVHPGGDHAILVGRVARFRMRPGRPLLFHAGLFRGLE
ncbi:MAG: flavin reductase family protein [Rhodothalassiaceae bacterium]